MTEVIPNYDIHNIKAGDYIEGPLWEGVVEVLSIERINEEYIRIRGVFQKNNSFFDKTIKNDDFLLIKKKNILYDFSSNPEELFLYLETVRFRYASLYDPLLAMNSSKIDPLPHQIDAVYRKVLKLPRIRFLIADDPGAGKTIMAGLIIKELKLRQLIKRVLIVVPGHLKEQWMVELAEKFKEDFKIINREDFKTNFRYIPWERYNNMITSLDFLKNEDILPTLLSVNFDLVIVDEAHKMSAYKYGNKTEKTRRYKVGELLSQRTEHLLFLTATPHKGDVDNFRLFLDLLEKGAFATNEMLRESIKDKDNHLFIRRLKEDLTDFEGKKLFKDRKVQTLALKMSKDSPLEEELYRDLSYYVKDLYGKAKDSLRRRNIAFALVILQRRFASSIYALYKSLQRRKKKIEDYIEGIENPEDAILPPIDEEEFIEEIEDMEEKEIWEKEKKWEAFTPYKKKKELEEERDYLEDLIAQAEKVINSGTEMKLNQLKETLYKLTKEHPEEKIIIFTESKDTLDYLKKNIEAWNYSVSVIHGGMSIWDRKQAEKEFKNETQILIATEAAGEGINLQFCHLMINYDIPWNPNRLEQRMGRIHRYGQKKNVLITNLVIEDTREGKVLTRLLEKIKKIRDALGSDRVFDVISEIYRGKRLYQILVETAAGVLDPNDAIEKEIGGDVNKEELERIKKTLDESLATRDIDYTMLRENFEKAKAHRLIPEYPEKFFIQSFKKAGGEVKEKKKGIYSINSIPRPIRVIANDEVFRRDYGLISDKYKLFTFDKQIVKNEKEDIEYVSFGHPLFEAIMQWVEKNYFKSKENGAVYIDPDGELSGYLLFFEGEIKDRAEKTAGKRLFAFYIKEDLTEIKNVSPSILWDLIKSENPVDQRVEKEKIKQMENIALSKLTDELESYKLELLEERKRQYQIKEKYSLRSLNYLIKKLDDELVELELKEDREKYKLAIINKRDRKRQYEEAKKELIKSMENDINLNIMTPSLITILKIEPLKIAPSSESQDPEVKKKIELIGMEIAKKYEIENNRIPTDVSSENLGYDIESESSNGNIRYIEVKAKAKSGSIFLTPNEWMKASNLKDHYYLYVIFNALEKPELRIIKNPAEKLIPQERVSVVKYEVDENQIIRSSNEG